MFFNAKSIFLINLFIIFILISVTNGNLRRPHSISNGQMSEIVLRAVETSMQRQSLKNINNLSNFKNNFITTPNPNEKLIAFETLNIEKLNKLIKRIDKGWTMPKRTSRMEPIGSNFQYKKTCASIYKARHLACEQPGFGIMCFNFCYEQGEELIFKCEDSSDISFCKSNSNFQELLTKYRRDTYRAKSYIHQMISRCYATAICNGSGLLNVMLPLTNGFERKKAKEKQSTLTITSKNNLTKNNTETEIFKEKSNFDSKNRWRKSENVKKKPQITPSTNFRPPKNNNIHRINKNSLSAESQSNSKDKITPKHVPFWQRLLVRKTTPKPESEKNRQSKNKLLLAKKINQKNVDSQEKNESSEWSDREKDLTITETTTQKTKLSKHARLNTSKDKSYKIEKDLENKNDVSEFKSSFSNLIESNKSKSTSSSKAWKNSKKRKKPHPTLTEPTSIDLKPSENTMKQNFSKMMSFYLGQTEPIDNAKTLEKSNIGFWNKFQPDRWYQSIHYITNTG